MMATLSSTSVVLAGDPALVKAVEEEDGDYEELIPPENFAMIEKGLYRSGFPKKKNFAFLKKSLQLKSILTLVLEDYPLANTEFNKMHGIKLLQFGVPGNKVGQNVISLK
ncbi:Cysteine protease [Phytophthora nicotianae]|uniref:Cysteine protease n=1 Tax=Phytophthora nicotianae TaxID=4792 RepID=A0A0W8DHF3_PHYNI|nr:Cysteine protease [Phytophthora nicotianae]